MVIKKYLVTDAQECQTGSLSSRRGRCPQRLLGRGCGCRRRLRSQLLLARAAITRPLLFSPPSSLLAAAAFASAALCFGRSQLLLGRVALCQSLQKTLLLRSLERRLRQLRLDLQHGQHVYHPDLRPRCRILLQMAGLLLRHRAPEHIRGFRGLCRSAPQLPPGFRGLRRCAPHLGQLRVCELARADPRVLLAGWRRQQLIKSRVRR